MTVPVIDLIFLLIVLVFAIIGAVNGFLNEVFGKAAPFVSAWVAILFYDKLVGPIEQNISIHWLSVILAFILIFVIVFIVMKILQILIRQIFDGEIFTSLDRFLGFLLGVAEGMAIVCIVLIIMISQPWFSVDNVLSGSYFLKLLGPIVSTSVNALSGSFAEVKSTDVGGSR